MRILSDSFIKFLETKHFIRRGRFVYRFETQYYPTQFGDLLCRDRIYRYEFEWTTSGALLINRNSEKVIWEGALEHA